MGSRWLVIWAANAAVCLAQAPDAGVLKIPPVKASITIEQQPVEITIWGTASPASSGKFALALTAGATLAATAACGGSGGSSGSGGADAPVTISVNCEPPTSQASARKGWTEQGGELINLPADEQASLMQTLSAAAAEVAKAKPSLDDAYQAVTTAAKRTQ